MSNSSVDKRVEGALEIALAYGRQVEGASAWCIDQMVRQLTGDEYDDWVKAYCAADEDGENMYDWDTGIAP